MLGRHEIEFFELYHIAATHLKKCFPHLKIGGPALAGKMNWAEDFLAQLKAPLDFFSWHHHAADPAKIALRAKETRELLGKYGFVNSESDDAFGHVSAACNGDEAAVMLTHFNDDDATEPKTFSLELVGFGGESGAEAELYVLDEAHDLEKLTSVVYFGDRLVWNLDVPNDTSYLVKIKKL